MITCYSIDGKTHNQGINFDSLDIIHSCLKNNWNLLNSIPVEAMILMLDEYSKKLYLNKKLLKVEGVPFLCYYFKKNNIEQLINSSLGDKRYLNEFIHKGNGKFIKAEGRGVACHWIAGNVSTLALYSVFQAVIAKNSSIIRVPKHSIDLVLKLLDVFDNIEVMYESNVYFSRHILKNISLIYFYSNDKLLNERMSILADARIIWGGEQAVKSISMLSKKTTCKDVVFGPKYSFAIFDKSVIESYECEMYMDRLVLDIATFNQKTCSSPQVLFIEKSKIPLRQVIEKLSKAFEKFDNRSPNVVDQGTAAKIINKRGIYSLSMDKNLCCSKGLSYTILINNKISLEEPVGGRCLFVKEIDSIFDVKALITRRIQTIGIGCCDEHKILEFAAVVTPLGVDRIVNLGLMNVYDYPWDGCFMINELIRWCSVNIA